MPEGPLRVHQIQAASIPLSTFLLAKGLTREEDAAVQHLGTDVLDAPDLRVLLVVRAPSRGNRAFARAQQGAREAQMYLRGPALVPPSRLIWTIAESDPSTPDGQVDVLLVRVPRTSADQPRARAAVRCSGGSPCR